jgi:hypothetical protein
VKTATNTEWQFVTQFTKEQNLFGQDAVWYYNDLGGLYDVTALRIEVPFSALPPDGMIAISYTELFSIPEPSALALAGLAMPLLLGQTLMRRR